MNEQSLESPEPVYEEDYYQFTWPTLHIVATLERFTDARDDEVRVELTVLSDDPFHGDEPIILKTGVKLLLTGPNSRRDIARSLSQDNPQFDWARMLEQVCGLAIRRYRQGTPSIDLWDVDVSESSRYLVRPLIVENAVTIWYGSGGEAKSLLALAFGCAIAFNVTVSGLTPTISGKVMYLDWEDDDVTHAERAHAICRGLGIEGDRKRIIYKRMAVSLYDAARDIRKEIIRENVKFVVIDSVGMAAGGDPSDANSIIRCLSAARTLGVTAVAIHHLAKPQDGKKQNKDTPYGSIYAVNEARATWLVEKDESEAGDLRVVMTNKKSNRARLQPRQSFGIEFIEDSEERLHTVRFKRMSFLEAADVGSSVDRKWKVMQAIRDNGPMTVKGMAVMLGMTEANVRTTINTNKEMFTSLPNPAGRADLIALSEETGTEIPVDYQPSLDPPVAEVTPEWNADLDGARPDDPGFDPDENPF